MVMVTSRLAWLRALFSENCKERIVRKQEISMGKMGK